MWKNFDADSTSELKKYERKWIRLLLKDENLSKDPFPMIKEKATKKIDPI